MATTSFLYHTLGLHGYRHLRTEYREGRVYHHVQKDRHGRRCAACGARWHALRLDGSFERRFLALPVGRRQQVVVLHGHRLACRSCGQVGRESIEFARGKARHLKSFARYVVELCQLAPIKHVAGLLGVGWDLVKDLYKGHLRSRLKKRKLSKVRYIAVDEFALRKGHVYMTVVLDLGSGALLHAQEGKDAQALIGFLERLKRSHAPLEAIAIDMSEAYLSAVRQVFGDRLDVVHDPYHVVALANQAIDQTRRVLAHSLQREDAQVLKGSRFLLLRGFEHLTDDAREGLGTLMKLNRPLYEVYILKEQLRLFWRLPNVATAEAFLDHWSAQAKACASRPFHRLAKTLERHRRGLLAYFRHRISTGPLEGLNNKIKVLKRQAYGFRDMEYFKLRLMFIHEANPSFAG